MKHSKLFECHADELRFLPGQDKAQAVFHSPEARKSHAPILLPGIALPQALSAVLLEIVEQMWVNAALFVLFEIPDALHQVRVSLRRLESFWFSQNTFPFLEISFKRSRSLSVSPDDFGPIWPLPGSGRFFFSRLFRRSKNGFSCQKTNMTSVFSPEPGKNVRPKKRENFWIQSHS